MNTPTVAADAPLITYERGGAGEIARLGVWNIGEVIPMPGTQFAGAWRVRLTDVPPRWRLAHSVEEAKVRLGACVLEWIDAAGLAPASERGSAVRAWRGDAVAAGGEAR